MPKHGFINTARPPQLSVRIEPVRNVLNTMMLIADCNAYPGVHSFVTQTQEALPRDVRRNNEIIMVGLHYAAMPEKDFSNFEAYLEDLEKTQGALFHQRVFRSYDMISAYKINIIGGDGAASVTQKDIDRLLSSKQIYLEYLEQCFGNENIDHDLEGAAYDYLVEPERLKTFLIKHLRYMWDNFLKEEFARQYPVLEHVVAGFNCMNFSSVPPIDIVNRITGHDIEAEWSNKKWELDWIKSSKKVVFTPSLHMGPYIGRRMKKDTMFIFYTPRTVDEAEAFSQELNRADIAGRLNTLSDDIRLRILKMLTQAPELSSKQIMEDLNLTQSSASRHLKQLSITGFIKERRQNSAKIYTLNPSFIQQTLEAVSAYLLGNHHSK